VGYNTILPGRLSMGSAPPAGARLPFDTLVLTAVEYQPSSANFPDVRVLRALLNDDGSPMTVAEMSRAIRLGREVARRVRGGERVLVTCAMGRNRSGVVTAIAMLEMGMSAPVAVRLIRRARGQHALRNRYFLDLIHLHSRPYAGHVGEMVP